MSVAIRLTRKGRKKRPFYRLVAIDRRARRDGRPIEDLGWYDPFTKEQKLKKERIEEWVKVGAKLSDRVRVILGEKIPYVIKEQKEEQEKEEKEGEKGETEEQKVV